MADLDTNQLISAGVLVLIIVFILVSMGHRGIHRLMQHAAIWALIFVGILVSVHIWNDINGSGIGPQQASFAEQGRVEVPRARDGHYYLTLDVNGTPIQFVVDTGASNIVLSQSDAKRVGLNPDELTYFGRAQTANGEVGIAFVRLDEINIGGMRDTNVPASVNQGDLFQSLLGMSYLSRWDRLEISNGTLVLERG